MNRQTQFPFSPPIESGAPIDDAAATVASPALAENLKRIAHEERVERNRLEQDRLAKLRDVARYD